VFTMPTSEGSPLPIKSRLLDDPHLLQRQMYPYLLGLHDSFIEQTDVILIVDGFRFPAHSQMLSAHSPVFSDMFSACTAYTGETHNITLHDTVEQVSALLSYLYGSLSSNKK
jgi:BTB/POZ domain